MLVKSRAKEKLVKFLTEAMTVKDLIETLSDFNPDLPVLIASDYGDYHHTLQVPISLVEPVAEEIEYLTESAYSHSGFALETLDDDTIDDIGGELDLSPTAARRLSELTHPTAAMPQE
jgi:hypothetical protein